MKPPAVLLSIAMLVILATTARADYRGPIQFEPQTFGNIRPRRFQITQLPRLVIQRENIRPQTLQVPAITLPALTPLPRPRRETFHFSRTIFGYVDDGPDSVPKKHYVPEKLRIPTRRVPLGW